jgi:hypothetical protein
MDEEGCGETREGIKPAGVFGVGKENGAA